MTEGNDNPLESYVRATLALQGYVFEDAEIAEIATLEQAGVAQFRLP